MDQHAILQYEARLREALGAEAIQIEVFGQLNSSNSYLMAKPSSSSPRPQLCWVLEQTAGRGRLNRSWLSDPAHSLTFSMAFDYAGEDWAALQRLENPASLSPATGWQLADCLQVVQPEVRVKWPNDLWRNGKKVAGILIESGTRGQLQRCVIGVGVNLFCPPSQVERVARARALVGSSLSGSSASGLSQVEPGSLFDQACSDERRLEVLATMVKALLKLWSNPRESLPLHGFSKDWNRLDALFEQPVQLYSDGQLVAQGLNAGVAADGCLQLHMQLDQQGTLKKFHVGELSLRMQGTHSPD